MKLEKAQEHYANHSGDLSAVNRQLAFAGIAVVWVFAVQGDDGSYSLANGLLFPLGCFVVGLGLDMCQYIASALLWGNYSRRLENGTATGEPHRSINWPSLVFFWLKPIATLMGYIALIKLIFS